MKRIFLIPSLLSFLFFACSKNENFKGQDPLDQEAAATLKSPTGGQMLNFNSQNELSAKVNSLRTSSLSKKMATSDVGFVSYKDYWRSLVKDDTKEKELLENSIISPDGDSYNLVPDPAFASLLNSKGEIQVENKIYKVTRFGTFIINLENYESTARLIDSLYKTDYRLGEKRMFTFETATEKPDYYKITDGVYRLDTYKDLETGKVKAAATIKTGGVAAPMLVDPGTIPSSNIVYTDYTNDKVFNNFDSKHRMRSNFYEYNWSTTTYIRVELTMQKKGWTGIWRELDTEELNVISNLVIMNRVGSTGFDPISIPSTDYDYYTYPGYVKPIPAGYTGDLVRRLNYEGRFEYTFRYKTAEVSWASQTGIGYINAPAGTSNKPSYTKMNVGCYAKYGGYWKGIVYTRNYP